MVNVRRLDTATLIRAVEELYRGELVRELHDERGLALRQIDTIRLSRAIAEAAQYFAEREPERVEALWQHIQGYRALLHDYRVRDEAVRERLARPGCAPDSAAARARRSPFPSFSTGWSSMGCPISCRAGSAAASRRRRRTTPPRGSCPAWWPSRCSGALETWLVWRLGGADLGGLLRALAPALGAPRLSLSRRRRPPAQPPPSGRPWRWCAVSPRPASWTRAQEIIAELERAKNDFLSATHGSSF